MPRSSRGIEVLPADVGHLGQVKGVAARGAGQPRQTGRWPPMRAGSSHPRRLPIEPLQHDVPAEPAAEDVDHPLCPVAISSEGLPWPATTPGDRRLGG